MTTRTTRSAIPSLRVTVDPRRCVANGKCTYAAPGIYVIDEETGVAYVDDEERATAENIFAGARACPTDAIIIEQYDRRVYPPILSPECRKSEDHRRDSRSLERAKHKPGQVGNATCRRFTCVECFELAWTSSPCRPCRPAASPGSLLLRLVGDERLGGEDHAGDRRRVLHRRAGDLGRVDDAGLDHVDVLVGDHVVADVGVLLLLLRSADHLDDDRAVLAGVGGDAAQRLLERAAQDVDAGLDVALGLDAVERGDAR